MIDTLISSFILDVACIVLFQSVYLNKEINIVFNEKFNFDIIFFLHFIHKEAKKVQNPLSI